MNRWQLTSTRKPIGYFAATTLCQGINHLHSRALTVMGSLCVDTVEVVDSSSTRPTTFQRTSPHSVTHNLATCVYKFARIFQFAGGHADVDALKRVAVVSEKRTAATNAVHGKLNRSPLVRGDTRALAEPARSSGLEPDRQQSTSPAIGNPSAAERAA